MFDNQKIILGFGLLIGEMSILMFFKILQFAIFAKLKNRDKEYKYRKFFYYIYRLVEITETCLLSFTAMLIMFLLNLTISYFVVMLLSTFLLVFQVVLNHSQFNFMMWTMILVLFYPLSVIFIKHFTLKQCKVKKNMKTTIAFNEFALCQLKRIPIKELINIFYVIMLIISSITKIGSSTSIFVFEQNSIFMSFTIYLAINTLADSIYKRYKIQIKKIDDMIFKSKKNKKLIKNWNFIEDLKIAKEMNRKFILTGEKPKNMDKFKKTIDNY